MSAHRLRAYLFLLLVAAIWGTAGPVIKFTLGGIAPLPFLAYRFLISAVLAILFFLFTGIKIPKPGRNLPLIVLYSILGFTIALGTLFLALEKTTVLDMTLVTLLGPMLVILGGAIFFRDQITKQEKIGIGLVFSGALFTALSPILINHGQLEFTGNLLLFLFLISDASATLIAKKLVQNEVPSLTIINLGFIIGALTIIPLTLFLYPLSEILPQIQNLSMEYHLGVWYMAVLSGTLAYFLYTRAQKSIEVSEAVLFRYLNPVFAIPLAIFWLKEKITLPLIIGATLILIGILIAEYKKKREK